MLPLGKRMVPIVGYISPVATITTVSRVNTTLVGYMDYTIIVSTRNMVGELCHIFLSCMRQNAFLNNPRVTHLVRHIDSVSRFFVIEVKS